MATIRPARADDMDALYEICLLTGDAGQDATATFRDPRILGHVFAAPYLALEPESCFVVEDQLGVGGYIVGTRDTAAFERREESEWWPGLRQHIADPGKPRRGMTADERMAYMIHHPILAKPHITAAYPAHLHINCLPRFQGIGLGKTMIDTWLRAMAAAGVKTAHLGVGPRNERGVRFYKTYGFHLVEQEPPPFSTFIFGIGTGA
ncbi:MAG TPA: GNAT family N-acetyltransferase [Rhizomicrobium sp.]|nr:GNAT family N-acetyltransferase [Rhizomicrobium sp.]